MAKTTETIELRVKSELSKLSKEVKALNKNLGTTTTQNKSMTKGLSSMRAGWIAVGATIVAVGAGMMKAVTAASALNEETQKFNTVFGTSEAVLKKASASVNELTTSYAMSQVEGTKMLAAMQDLLKPLGIAPEKAADFSAQVVKLSADMGSFNNMPTAAIMNDIQSALVGMNRPMMKYGTVLTAATVKQKAINMGLHEGTGELSAAARAQATLTMIMETQADAQGDMIRTGTSYANTLKNAKAKAEDLWAMLGKNLMPVFRDLLQLFVDGASKGGFLYQTIDYISDSTAQLARDIKIAYHALGAFKDSFVDNSEAIEKLEGHYKNLISHAKVLRDQFVAGKDKLGLYNKVKQEAIEVGIKLNALREGESHHLLALNKLMQKSVVDVQTQAKAKIKAARDSSTANTIETNTYKTNMLLLREYKNEDKLIELEEEQAQYEALLEKFKDDKSAREEIEKQHKENVAQIEKDAFMASIQRGILYAQNTISTMQGMLGQISAIYQQEQANQMQSLQNHETQVLSLLDSDYQRRKQWIMTNVKDEDERIKALAALEEEFASKKTGISKHTDILERRLKHRAAVQNKKLMIMQTIMTTALAAMQAFSAMAIIPFVGPILGAAAAAGVAILGGIMVAKIRSAPIPAAAEGALIQGSQQGSLIRAGEGGRSEAIIPLENPDAMSKLGGMGGTTYVFNIENLYGTDEMPEEVATRIDRALYQLQLNKNSTFAEAVS